MALTKQNLAVPFASGISQKTDPKQLDFGKFEQLENVVYNVDKRIDKRNGFRRLSQLPANVSPTTINTFDGNLTVIGSSIQSYIDSSATWIDKGRFQPIELSTLSIQKNSLVQTSCDCAYSDTGLVCVTYLDSDGVWRYQINDSNNGATLVSPTALPTGAYGVRVSSVVGYFFITYVRTSGAIKLFCLPVPTGNINSPLAEVEISASVLSTTSLHDTYAIGNQLYISWEASDGGGGVRTTILDTAFNVYPSVLLSASAANRISITLDTTTTSYVVWVAWYSTAGTTVRVAAYNASLVPLLTTTVVDSTKVVNNLSIVASSDICSVFTQVTNTYSYSATRSDYIQKASVTLAGSVTPNSVMARNVGLASKAFGIDGRTYMLSAMSTSFQPSYYLLDDSGACVARLAYGNGGGYIALGVLPSVTLTGSLASLSYLIKDSLIAVNKEQSPDAPGGVYTGTGINIATFDTARRNLSTAEIGGNLHIAGGYVWNYDGTTLSEQGFQYWPEDFAITTSGVGGLITAQTYFYQITYEWTDAKGNIHRSAPSIPGTIVTTGATSSNTLNIPTLRLTYKGGVRVVIYRWSTAQQNYYQVTSITSPTLNNPAVDSITYVDTLADSSIIGNPLIYTTGGVVENIPAPACSSLSLYQSRLVLIDSEQSNVVWYSKQVGQSTPVEMSDLFTLFVSPSIGSQGSTGKTEVLYPLDEKLLFFKSNAVYFMTGAGPDATGINNDFSEPSFITAAVGSVNQDSMATIPQGVVFQSNKGVWMLGRELSTSYIGADVEDGALSSTVTSSQAVPGATQVRMLLNNGTALVYDYYFDRWSTFTNIPSISSTVYQDMHTYLTPGGEVRQESEGYFKDGLSNPVQLRVITPWYNLMGLQGFQRASQVYLLGTYATPHTIRVSVYYDYEDSPSQVIDLVPQDWMGVWGESSPLWGDDSVWGNGASLEQYRIFLNRQKMQAFKLDIQEMYDGSYGEQPGAGLSLSGLNVVVATKKGYVPLPASRSFG